MPRIARLLFPAFALAVGPVAGQTTLERPPAAPDTWTGVPWSLELSVTPLFGRTGPEGTGLHADPALRAALALPAWLVVEARYAPQPVERAGDDEVEAALRATPLRQDHGRWLDLGAEARIAAGSDVGALTATGARWFGPLRVQAHAAALVPRDGDARLAAGGAALWHPAPGHVPLALTAGLAALADPAPGERVAWTAGVQLGISFTAHSLSVYVTNAGQSLPGRAAGTDRTRVGVELTTHVPVGRFFGRYTPRDVARDAVRPAEPPTATATVPIRDYRYTPARVVIPAGGSVRWVNHDRATHTATADDGSWNSGGLQEGESWTAVFEVPGVYPYHCGPHPFMRGVVVVTESGG